MNNQPTPPSIEQQRQVNQALRSVFVATEPQVEQLARMSDSDLVRWARGDRNRVIGLRQMALGLMQSARGSLDTNEALFGIIETLQKQVAEQEAAITAQRGRIVTLENQLAN